MKSKTFQNNLVFCPDTRLTDCRIDKRFVFKKISILFDFSRVLVIAQNCKLTKLKHKKAGTNWFHWEKVLKLGVTAETLRPKTVPS